MNQRIRQIIEEARKLSPHDRRDLLGMLDAEFGGELAVTTDEEIESAWQREVELRVEAAERGEFGTVDFDIVMARARAIVGRT